jgi:hypothetical protein
MKTAEENKVCKGKSTQIKIFPKFKSSGMQCCFVG